MAVDIYLTVLAGVVGLLIGSFLNVVIHRVPVGGSLVRPPSACPKCGAGIRWYDNIPVLSWVVLRGKCRNCSATISVRYPLVELGTGLLFGLVAWLAMAGMSMRPWRAYSADDSAYTVASTSGVLVLAALLYFAAISIALALIDLDTGTLPNRIVLPAYVVGGLLLGTASLLERDYAPLAGAAIGMVALFTFYLLLAIVRPGGMGMGDVKLAGAIGLYLGWLGWGALIVGAFIPFLLGGLFSIGLLITRRVGRASRIPFGPWMLVGAWIAILVGKTLVEWYLSLYGVS